MAQQEPPVEQELPPGSDHEQSQELLARGPVHEAFMSPLDESSQPAEVIPNEPPQPIDEIPPETRPEGNVEWIPGYWFWSPAENDFIWVSGVWRESPPGQRWIPGYWAQADGGYRWISGMWAAADQGDLTYLDPPPESLEVGPSSPAPSDEHFWVPGCWVYQQNDYRWRAGYWGRHQDGWMWVPNYYCWTPRGVVFTGGYWDYPVANRGLLFAPVLFRNNYYRQPGFRYSPSAVVLGSRLLLHLFVGPRYHHYYYGNYYGDTNYGFSPWFNHRSPILNYYTWYFGRQNVPYVSRLQNWYGYQNRTPDARPAITFRQQQNFARGATGTAALSVLTQPLTEVIQGRSFVNLDQNARLQLGQSSTSLQTLARQRVEFEANRGNLGAGANANTNATARGQLSLPQVSRVFRPIIGDNVPGQSDNLPGDRRLGAGQPGDGRIGDGRPGLDNIPGVRDVPGLRDGDGRSSLIPGNRGPDIRRGPDGPAGSGDRGGPQVIRPDSRTPATGTPDIRRPDTNPGQAIPNRGPSRSIPSGVPGLTPGRGVPQVNPGNAAPRANSPTPNRSLPNFNRGSSLIPNAPNIPNAPSINRGSSPSPSLPSFNRGSSPSRSVPSFSPGSSSGRSMPSFNRGGFGGSGRSTPSMGSGRSSGNSGRGGGGGPGRGQ